MGADIYIYIYIYFLMNTFHIYLIVFHSPEKKKEKKNRDCV